MSLFRVTHLMVVRKRPSLDSPALGALFKGQVVSGRRQGNWLRLDEQSGRLAEHQILEKQLEEQQSGKLAESWLPCPTEGPKYALIDACRAQWLGVLLQESDGAWRGALREPWPGPGAGHAEGAPGVLGNMDAELPAAAQGRGADESWARPSRSRAVSVLGQIDAELSAAAQGRGADESWLPLPASVSARHRGGGDRDGTDSRSLPQKSANPDSLPKDKDWWRPLDEVCVARRVDHSQEVPLDRRAKSWSRTLAYAQVQLGLQNVPLRRGTPDRPFVFWVLGATEEVEVHLARHGFFADANFADRAATEVMLFGESIQTERLEQGRGGSQGSYSVGSKRVAKRGATIKKDDAATYTVVYSSVNVRAEPRLGPDSRIVGSLYKGQTVHGREDNGWLRLNAASVKLCSESYDGTAWVLINGKACGKGILLKRQAETTAKSNGSRGQAKTGKAALDSSLDASMAEDAADVGPQEGGPPHVLATSYKGLQMIGVADEPDMVVIFMPAFNGGLSKEDYVDVVPESVFGLVAKAPTVITLRCQPTEAFRRSLRHKLRNNQLLLEPSRCLFSAAAGEPFHEYDDNGWFLAVQGPGALATVLGLQLTPEYRHHSTVPAVFWGIVDLKYDPGQPIFERVKMLETGDGLNSKFSGVGADIQRRFQDHYELEAGVVLKKIHFASADKKLFHDLMTMSGYEHLVPLQACFPRYYDEKLAERIIAALGVDEGDCVMLKLCNRSRAAGVLIVPVNELDDVLEELLLPPQELEGWFAEHLQQLGAGAATDLGIRGKFDENTRHWWSNESPYFVVDRWCKSIPVKKDDKLFDGTMRVSFVLRRKKGHQAKDNESLNPEDLEVEWLGAYWKLPSTHMESEDLRARVVSAARTSGTAAVKHAHLFEVYAALGDSIQQIFGGQEMNPETFKGTYKQEPSLAAYFTARLGMSMADPQKMQYHLDNAESQVRRQGVQHPSQVYVKSYIKRAWGVLHAKEIDKSSSAGRWENSTQYLRASLKLLPTNANTLHLLGMAALDEGRNQEAKDWLNRSLLLDPDYRATYVNLGVAYLRLGFYDQAIQISERGLTLFGNYGQITYNKGVAQCQLALAIDALEVQGGELTSEQDREYEELRKNAKSSLTLARGSPEAAKRRPQPGKKGVMPLHPWTLEDDRMCEAMSSSARPGERIELPPPIGWDFHYWRM